MNKVVILHFSQKVEDFLSTYTTVSFPRIPPLLQLLHKVRTYSIKYLLIAEKLEWAIKHVIKLSLDGSVLRRYCAYCTVMLYLVVF
jgi:hypothetical protein